MSNLREMSSVAIVRAKNTHYAVSTFAAIVYAVVWLMANDARAAASTTAQETLPEVVITASRDLALPEFVISAQREPAARSAAVLGEVVIYGRRESAVGEKVASAVSSTPIKASAKGGTWISKARHWLQSALLK
jgi:hypothetical protein